MTETVRYTYRLRVGATCEKALMQEWHRVRFVWNWAVERFRKRLPTSNKKLCAELTHLRAHKDWLRAGSVVCQQQAIRDFVQSRDRFFANCKKSAQRRHGKPNFKSAKRTRPSVNYTTRGFRIDGEHLILAKGIRVRIVLSRNLPSPPSSVRVYQDAVGDWWASFVLTRESVTRPRLRDGDFGCDFGISTTVTATNPAYDLSFVSMFERHARNYRRYQRRMDRFRKEQDEKRYKAAKRDAARVQRRAARQRKGRARAYAHTVARNHARIALEDIQPRFMAQSRLAKKMSDAALTTLKSEMIAAARTYGCDIHLVNPAYTTQDCSNCGARTKTRLPLSQRTYICAECGLVCDRDRNAAYNVALRAGLNPEPMTKLMMTPLRGDVIVTPEVRISRL